jgi:hypothetical protein
LVNTDNASALDMALSKNHQQSAMYIQAFIEAWFVQNPNKDAQAQ